MDISFFLILIKNMEVRVVVDKAILNTLGIPQEALVFSLK